VVKAQGLQRRSVESFLVLSVCVGLTGCGDNGAKPLLPRPAQVEFLGWDCCGGDCPPDTLEWVAALGRIRNVGDLTAYNVLWITQPCSTCFSGSFGSVDSMEAGAERTIYGVRAQLPARCPVAYVCWTSHPDSVTRCPPTTTASGTTHEFDDH